jgi:hypothetical protein
MDMAKERRAIDPQDGGRTKQQAASKWAAWVIRRSYTDRLQLAG